MKTFCVNNGKVYWGFKKESWLEDDYVKIGNSTKLLLSRDNPPDIIEELRDRVKIEMIYNAYPLNYSGDIFLAKSWPSDHGKILLLVKGCRESLNITLRGKETYVFLKERSDSLVILSPGDQISFEVFQNGDYSEYILKYETENPEKWLKKIDY
ncbi:MAG: hypothetical protein WC795_01415 [Candidatus Paceibacterota bacterium]|jgi:hypothetical protein